MKSKKENQEYEITGFNIADVVKSVSYHKQGLVVNDLLSFIQKGYYDRKEKQDVLDKERKELEMRVAELKRRKERELRKLEFETARMAREAEYLRMKAEMMSKIPSGKYEPKVLVSDERGDPRWKTVDDYDDLPF